MGLDDLIFIENAIQKAIDENENYQHIRVNTNLQVEIASGKVKIDERDISNE